MSDMIRLVLVDDHPAIREGIKTILSKHDQKQAISIVGEAGSLAEAEVILSREEVDIVLIDITLADGASFDLMKRHLQGMPNYRFLVLSMHLNPEYILEALQAGAFGYLTKSSASHELINAINRVYQGDYYLDSKSLSTLCIRLSTMHQTTFLDNDIAYASLTTRERATFIALASGKSIKEIAFENRLSSKTIENRKTAIMKKLCIANTLELFEYAERIGVRKRRQ
jgi:DNA-binding NarL/FixJ family response regulator